jgi:tetratricopeptide (TPR) repeat protein
MVSGLRKILLLSGAFAAVACAPLQPRWTVADLFGVSPEAEEYGDFLAARYAGMTGDAAEAANYYRRAFDRSPEDPEILERAAFSTLIAGEVETAVSLARGADPVITAESPSAQLALVIADIADGRNATALARLRTSQIGVINQDVASFLTAWLTAETDVDGGVRLLSTPQGRRFPGGEPFYMQALVLAKAGRDQEALKAFGDGARFQTGSSTMLVAAHARLLAATGDTAKAREVLGEAAARDVSSVEIDQLLAKLDAGRPVEPLRLSTKAGAASAIYLASAGGLARSSPELMTMRLSLALHVDPDFTPARLLLANALGDLDKTDRAIEMLQAVKADSPWYATARLGIASLNQSSEREAAAFIAAQEAVEASPSRSILLGAGDIFRAQKRWLDAERMYDEVVRADAASGREDWRPLFARATARERLGRWQDAEADAQKALKITPDRPELLNFLGYNWVDRNTHVEEGMKLIRQAVAARPDAGYIVDSLGWAHYRLGEYEQAVEELERAVSLSPGDAEIVSHLGDAYWRAGRPTEAGYEWRDALALKPDTELEAALKSRLEHGLDPVKPRAVAEAPAGRP